MRLQVTERVRLSGWDTGLCSERRPWMSCVTCSDAERTLLPYLLVRKTFSGIRKSHKASGYDADTLSHILNSQVLIQVHISWNRTQRTESVENAKRNQSSVVTI